MEIIAHRGAWIGDEAQGIPAYEKNSVEAFETAIEFGFGIETDFRDICGKIVVSHNPPESNALSAENFFQMVIPGQIIAVNVKADGLAARIKTLWQKTAPKCCPFAFDMSVPDTLDYLKTEFPFYERQSEYEKTTVWNEASGFWLDGFHSVWFDHEEICSLLDTKKPVCIVSPELHKRDYRLLWDEIAKLVKIYPEFSDNIYLCTDQPFVAERFFNRKKGL